MSPIKEFSVTYEAVNAGDTFSPGDTVTGTLSFTLKKETKVKILVVKVKGEAYVHWSRGIGDDRRTFTARRKYVKAKQYLIAKDAKDNVLPKGIHRFKFSLNIPRGDMPSSFKALQGWIVYMIEAKLSRKWHLPSVTQKELHFVSSSFPQPVMSPQTGSFSKQTGVFTKGEVQMSATIDRTTCSPGDTLSICAKINNLSSKQTRPKVSLQQRAVFSAMAHTEITDLNVFKVEGDPIEPNSEDTFSCQIKIPQNTHTIHNCDIISVTFYIKVYLDVRFAIDPAVVFPLDIVNSSFSSHHPGGDFGPYPAAALGPPSYSDFPAGGYPVPSGPGAYGYPGAPHPAQHANIASGYNNPFPEQAAPYGFTPTP